MPLLEENRFQMIKRKTQIELDEAIILLNQGKIISSDQFDYWTGILYRLLKMGFPFLKGRLSSNGRACIWKWTLQDSPTPLPRTFGNISCGSQTHVIRATGSFLVDF